MKKKISLIVTALFCLSLFISPVYAATKDELQQQKEDVYKRQPPDRPTAMRSPGRIISYFSTALRKGPRIFFMMSPLSNKLPVSYTHLDVYKRQI